MLNLFQRCGGPLRLQNYGIKVKMKGHEDYLFSQTLCFGQILGIRKHQTHARQFMSKYNEEHSH